MPIRILPVHLVNRIAAGEVIERPASIVKELVENSLDAGATRIDVAIEDGGKKLIRVTDDGCGMDEADLALALRPHATSKLPGEEDLFSIATLGFRGEALASVGAVSHAHIRTGRRDAPDGGGFEIQASGETIGEVRPCAAAPGTTVAVRDLFFNTPARRKFLRTANTESAHVAEQVTRLAVPHSQVAFTLAHNGREVHSLPACEGTRRRVSDLFGAALGDALLPLAPRGDGAIRIDGLIAPPSAARSSGKWQYVFLNGRYIRDRSLAHALREAYRGLLEPSRFPVAFIFIEMPPVDVDVNVHPTKVEVRFRNSQQVHGALLAALRETLNRANLAPTASLDRGAGATPADAGDSARKDSLRSALADFFKSAPPPQPRLSFPGPARGGAHQTTEAPPERFPLPLRLAKSASPAGLAQTEQAAAQPQVRPREDRTSPAFQVHDSYIVARRDDGLIIVDQHALHERILYNAFRERLAAGALTAQRLLIPATFAATAAEADLLAASGELLGRLGVEVSAFGPDTLAVQQFPTLLAERGVDAAEFLREVVDRLSEDETTNPEQALESILQTMACKAAVKAGEPLTHAEMESLLTRADEVEKSSSCPHGRPTTLKLTLRDLEKQFKRT